MKIATYNANGIRARLALILAWLEKEFPDVLCLQETKVQDKDFPQSAVEAAQYYCVFRGQKAYSGVAILSKERPEDVEFGLGNGEEVEEPRLIKAAIRGVPIVNTYVPQGYAPGSERFQLKLQWLERLRNYFMTRFDPAQPLLWAGDFNVAPNPEDVYDPKGLLGSVGFHPDEQAALEKIKAWGFEDVFRRHDREPGRYTFWDYRIPNAVRRRLGWRIDHVWATQILAGRSLRAWIDMESRLSPKPSDHAFVVTEFDDRIEAAASFDES